MDDSLKQLDQMWALNKAFLHRFLISLAKDIDLADDLLQDTYVRAHNGFGGYKGGDTRAWLTAIAKAAFYTHIRRKAYSHEQLELNQEYADSAFYPGSQRHFDTLFIRQAVENLPSQLRTTLIMKYYAEMTYEEIAARTGCPVGTVKWRVNAAVDKLRSRLGISRVTDTPGCPHCSQLRILDYLCFSLPADEAVRVQSHIKGCEYCAALKLELESLRGSLDHIEGDRRMMHIVEINKRGLARLYSITNALNETEEVIDTAGFYVTRKVKLLHWISQDTELVYKQFLDPEQPERIDFRAPLPRPAAPGERIEHLAIMSVSPEEFSAKPNETDGFRFEWNQRPSRDSEFAYIQAIRLPAKAKLTLTEPDPHEIRNSGVHTTVIWSTVLAADERFSCSVEYYFNK